MKRPLYLLFIASLALQSFANDSIVGLRTLGVEKPLGIESTPAFSWKIESSRRGYRQSAYEITVTDSRGTTLWKSGKVASSRQTDVPYEGKPLKSRSAYTWTITAFDQNDIPSTTAVSSFETGILTQEEWKDAQWIAPKKSPYNAIVEITPNKGTVKSRYVRLNVTDSGPHAASDPNNAFVQIAEIEIYDKEGNNRARNATFTATNSWELTNHGWSIKYINDGVIKGGTNGFTTTQNNTATTIVADLGDTYEIARVILYPRQDVSAVNDATSAANFPSTYTLELGTTPTNYTKQFKAIKANPPSFDANNNVPYIGRNFTTPKGKTISQARLYASAVGVFTMHLNGKPVTQNVLEPGETQYDKHVLYNTYDVTPLIVSGKNTILAQVAGGIANMSSMSDRFVKHELASDEATTSLRAMLYITYSDGTTQCVNTDSQWVSHKSPTTGSNWYGGEDYDARLAIKDLFTTGYDIGAWERCEVVSPSFVAPSVSPKRHKIGLMRAKEYEPLRIVETWPAVSVTKNAKGNYLVDFGQNFAGTYSFCLKAKKGTTITIYDSELQADSACKFEYMYEASGTSNKTLDKYTFRGDKKGETWGPEFMYHGFRYLEISGLDEAPSPSSFTAKRIRSNMANVSHFKTSNTLLNDIHRMCYNGIQSQLYNTVTDCPHREKLGWLDVPNMMYQSLCYNFDIKSLLNKVVMDAFDAQGANGYVPSTVPHFMRAYDDDLNWGGASITIPWRNYKQYGDMTLMRRYYDKMKKLITYYGTLTQDHIVRNDYSVLSDWGQETSGLEHHTSSSFTLTCAYYYLLGAMTEMATALGHTEDADVWKKTAADVKAAFNKRFFKDGVYEYGNQANYGMALYYGLVDEADIPHVAKALAKAVESSQYSVKTGEIGLRPTIMSLANNGYNDIVYKMVNKTTYPSYGFWVAQGATTSLEYWDMSLSQNHCMMDHIEEWFFSCLGGISNTGEAYETIQIHPWIPTDMASADISVVTPRGKVRMAWSRTEKTTTYDITVPAGSVADVVLPIMEGKKLYEDGKEIGNIASIGNLTYSNTTAHFTLGSGNYSFTMDGSTLTDGHTAQIQNR
ncbi:MAG: glycoside hydrolase family 78 protein [Bacteroidaceae bacterium]|nr:glycoside hydrolase family 78 protein [Bacteroidaceae bacterium]